MNKYFLLGSLALFSQMGFAKTFECKLIQYGDQGTLVQHHNIQVVSEGPMKSEKFNLNGIVFELRTFEGKTYVRISPESRPTSYFYLSALAEDKHMETTFALDVKDGNPIVGAVDCKAN